MMIAATMKERKTEAIRRKMKMGVPATTTMPETTKMTRMAIQIWRAARKRAMMRCGFTNRVVSFCCIKIGDSQD